MERKRTFFFGCVDDEQDVSVQTIDCARGERVIGIAVLAEEDEVSCKASAQDDDNQSIISASSHANTLGGMEHIVVSAPAAFFFDVRVIDRIKKFLTNYNEHDIKLPVKYMFTAPEHLAAIKLDFNYDRLISWAPIFNPHPSGSTSLPSKELAKIIRFPWRTHNGDIREDRDIPESSFATCTFFCDRDDGRRIDAVTGYVDRTGQFCGLLFRRDGKWSKEAFGQRSAYGIFFELEDDERFDAIYLPQEKSRGRLRADALALSTNRGRTTPWFGKIGRGTKPFYKKAPPGHIGVGVFGAAESKPILGSGFSFETLGLLHRPASPGAPSWDADVPELSSYHRLDHKTGLKWLNNVLSWPKDIVFSALTLGDEKTYWGRDSVVMGRGFGVFDPAKLLQIRVWTSGSAIVSVRFRGGPDMGFVTFGDWPDARDIKLGSDKKMTISGPDGERIVRIKVAFQKLRHEERVLGLVFETSYGRSKTMVCPELSPERPIDRSSENVMILECHDPAKEIVGLHGIYSAYELNHIGLLMKKTPGLQDCSNLTFPGSVSQIQHTVSANGTGPNSY